MNWRPVKGKCQVCGHAGYCTRTSDGLVIKCMRAPNDKPVKQKDGATGYLYKTTELGGGKLPPLPAAKAPPVRTVTEWKLIVKRHQSSINPKKLEACAARLGLSVRALKLYGIGIDTGGYDDRTGTGWWSFPMYGGDGKICGIRLRSDDGKKVSVVGSKNGLFIPTNYSGDAIPEGVCNDEAPLLLVLPEGPTSAAACADINMGFCAIGRPNNQSGGGQLLELLSRGSPKDVVIIADDEGTKWTKADSPSPFWPGWEGALSVALQIQPKCHRLRVCRLRDAAGKRIKDPRDWLNGKHAPALIEQIFVCAEDATPKWLATKKREVEKWRKGMHQQKIKKPA